MTSTLLPDCRPTEHYSLQARVEQGRQDRSWRLPSFTMDQITFGVKPFRHTLPALLMARKSGPELIPATIVDSSIAVFTQFGIGTVRMWPPFPFQIGNQPMF